MFQAGLQAFFHAWERRLASVTKDRVVRPFEWGLDWIGEHGNGNGRPPADVIGEWVAAAMADTSQFFSVEPTAQYELGPALNGERLLTFPSALTTPHPSNNTVSCRYFPARGRPPFRAPAATLDSAGCSPGTA